MDYVRPLRKKEGGICIYVCDSARGGGVTRLFDKTIGSWVL